MANSENSAGLAKAKEPRSFFAKQLAGEQPLSFETAQELYRLAMSLLELRPWEAVDDQEFILIQDEESGEICYCSVLGGLGMVYAVNVYVGAESYRFRRRILEGKAIAPGDFYGTLRAVTVEYVLAREQTPPDRELLAAFGQPGKRGGRAPIFRALRPGYNPWYLTEKEGTLLAGCLRGVLALCIADSPADCLDFWEREDEFPLLVPIHDDATRTQYEVRLVSAPEPPSSRPQPVALDERLVDDILKRIFPKQGSLEADYFFAIAEIGEKNERKACLSAAVVCDGDSGFAFQPELGMPGDPPGNCSCGLFWAPYGITESCHARSGSGNGNSNICSKAFRQSLDSRFTSRNRWPCWTLSKRNCLCTLEIRANFPADRTKAAHFSQIDF